MEDLPIASAEGQVNSLVLLGNSHTFPDHPILQSHSRFLRLGSRLNSELEIPRRNKFYIAPSRGIQGSYRMDIGNPEEAWETGFTSVSSNRHGTTWLKRSVDENEKEHDDFKTSRQRDGIND